MSVQLSDDYSIDATALLNLDKALVKFGLDPVSEICSWGLQPSDLNSGDLRIPLGRVAEILQHCIHITACDHFVLELVQLQTEAINSYFGMLLRTSPSLGEAFQIASRELHIHAKGANWAFQREGKCASLSLSFDVQRLEFDHRYILAELGIAQAWFMIRNQCQQSVQLDSVCFVRNNLADNRPYRRFFNAPVQFNCDYDQLNMPAGLLDIPMSHSDLYLHAAIRELVHMGRANTSGRTLEQEVCTIIRMLLPQGRCTIERVAGYLMRDKRTLQRQLRDEFDVTFHALRQAERLKLAQIYLEETDKSIIQIAYATGYNEPGNLARAFRNQFHCTPQQWRERHD